MKKNEKIYKESRYGRDELFAISVVLLIVALASAIVGVVLIVKGCVASGVLATTWRIIVGILLVLLGLFVGGIGIVMLFTAISMIKAVDGSVKDVGNSAKGMANTTLCSKCGTELGENAQVCTNCGTPVDKSVKCPNCKTINTIDDKFCSKCGNKLKD